MNIRKVMVLKEMYRPLLQAQIRIVCERCGVEHVRELDDGYMEVMCTLVFMRGMEAAVQQLRGENTEIGFVDEDGREMNLK